MPLIIEFSVLILNKLIILFVDGVVSQMCELVLFTALSLIWLTSEPSQSFMIDIDTPRINASDEDIYSQIEL